MPAGIQIFNDYGTVSVDQDYFNLGLLQRGSFSTVSDPGYPGGSTYRLTSSLEAPIVALSPPRGSFVSLISIVGGPGNWEYNFVIGAPVGSSVDFFIFGTAPSIGSNYGLEVFNAQGTLVYSAATTIPMRIVDIRAPMATGNVTYTAGRRYAVVMNTPTRTFRVFFTGDVGNGTPARTNQQYGMSSFQITDNTVGTYYYNYVNSFQNYKPTDVERNDTYPGAAALVVDVTDM